MNTFIILLLIAITIFCIVTIMLIAVMVAVKNGIIHHFAIERGHNCEKFSATTFLQKELRRPYEVLSSFMGKDVGILGDGKKWYGCYIEHIILFYWILGPSSILTFTAVKMYGEPIPDKDYLYYVLAIFLWLMTNIITDGVSLLITKFTLSKIVNNEKDRLRDQLKWLLVDFFIACLCFLVAVAVTSGVYAVQTNNFDMFFKYIITPEIVYQNMITPYYFDTWNEEPSVTFPLQLVASLTSYVPTIIMFIYIPLSYHF